MITISGRRFVVVPGTDTTSGPFAGPVNFQFNLPVAARTSAGVYKPDGTLVRQLWGNIDYQAGTYTATWDGTADVDLATILPQDNYYVEVLDSNVEYTWEGVVANTSANTTTRIGKHRSFLPMSDLCTTASKAFYCTHYNERGVSQGGFLYSSTQVKIEGPFPQDGGVSQSTEFCCTDGIYVYWSGDKAGSPTFFIHATLVSDYTPVTFSSGTTHEGYNAIALNSDRISGIAVQSSGSYLFVSHNLLNQLHVHDKSTGALVRTIGYTTPGVIKIRNNDLWVISGTTVNKHTINSDGTISGILITKSGFDIPFGMDINYANTVVSIMDAGSKHQIFSYDTTTGNSVWTLGQVGGYLTNSRVYNNKFDFYGGFMAYQPDGTFWVGDKGNYRTIHFDASRNYIENIAYLPATYRTTVNLADASRVFADNLEFSMDYSIPLSGTNGSWSLYRNFRNWMPIGEELGCVSTLSNSRTYALMTQHSDSTYPYNWKVVELTDTGLRDCSNNHAFGIGSQQMKKDGRISQIYSFIGVPQEWREQLLTGFDTSGNPQWGSQSTIATTPTISNLDPWSTGVGGTMRAGEETSTGYLCVLNSYVPPTNEESLYHFGIVKRGENKWKVKTGLRTFKNYKGYFPSDGGFDIGNSVGPYGGSVALAYDSSFYWGYHGEFWKSNQINFWNHIYQNGLPVGNFGSQGGDAGMAGNSFNGTMAKNSYGTYLFHNDESVHQGIHRWKISGLGSIRVTRITDFLPYTEILPDGLKLMRNLPFDTVFNGNDLWTLNNPQFYHQVGDNAERFVVRSYSTRYNPRLPGDLYIEQAVFAGGSYDHNYSLDCDLQVSSPLTTWELYGEISFPFALPANGNQYLEVLDNTDKIIAQFYYNLDFNAVHHDRTAYVNNVPIYSAYETIAEGILWNPNTLKMSRSGSNIKFEYAGLPSVTTAVLDSGADVTRPTKLRVLITGSNYDRRMTLADWTFRTNF